MPDRIVPSAWLEHAPFAFWLIDAVKPATLVELGTHRGFSFFAFCQAVARLNLSARCFAVDSWKGDEHSGFYDDDLFNQVNDYNNDRYSSFAQLVRATFDEALDHFSTHSIDLLHIDGRHRYADIRHDFESWLPKLSPDAVVLFHDIMVRRDDFGVWRYWEELKEQYPSFEFLHGYGLGVISLREPRKDPLKSLFDASPATLAQIRSAYSTLGAAVRTAHLHRELLNHCQSQAIELNRQSDELAALRARAEQQATDAATELEQQIAKANLSVVAAGQRVFEEMKKRESLQVALSEKDHHLQWHAKEVAYLNAQRTELERAVLQLGAAALQLRAIETSTSWRLTSPLRAALARAPRAAHFLRRFLKLVWWTATLQLPRRLRERRARLP